jgi:hypothetical protein
MAIKTKEIHGALMHKDRVKTEFRKFNASSSGNFTQVFDDLIQGIFQVRLRHLFFLN